MNEGLRKTVWFVGLWLAGVGTVTIIGLMIRAALSN